MIGKLARYFGVDEVQIVRHQIADDEIVCLVDYGIGGIKKYRLVVTDLPAAEKAEQSELDPNDLTVRQIRELESLDMGTKDWQRLIDAEKAGKNRSSVISYAESKLDE